MQAGVIGRGDALQALAQRREHADGGPTQEPARVPAPATIGNTRPGANGPAGGSKVETDRVEPPER